MPWLITYMQRNSSYEPEYENTVTKQRPAEWLRESRIHGFQHPVVLMNAVEITAAEAKNLEDVL